MEQDLIIENWLRRKLSYHHYYRLRQPVTVEYEFKGQLGHPSSYAYVRFECQPTEKLCFQSTAVWPEDLTENWVGGLEAAVCEAIVDGLVCSSFDPYVGCSLNLVRIKYDEISSSPAAYYRATKGAMAELVKDTIRQWEVWPLDYLSRIGQKQ